MWNQYHTIKVLTPRFLPDPGYSWLRVHSSNTASFNCAGTFLASATDKTFPLRDTRSEPTKRCKQWTFPLLHCWWSWACTSLPPATASSSEVWMSQGQFQTWVWHYWKGHLDLPQVSDTQSHLSCWTCSVAQECHGAKQAAEKENQEMVRLRVPAPIQHPVRMQAPNQVVLFLLSIVSSINKKTYSNYSFSLYKHL